MYPLFGLVSLDKQTVYTDLVLVLEDLMVERSRIFTHMKIVAEASLISFFTSQDHTDLDEFFRPMTYLGYLCHQRCVYLHCCVHE